jgi:undecaprenol kinase
MAPPMNRVSQYFAVDDEQKVALPGTGILVTSTPQRWHASRWRALRCAVDGLLDAWRTQPNVRLHVATGAGVILVGLWCGLTLTEWLWISFAIGLVIFAELMNTAIEQTVDLVVGPRLDPLAKKVKDVAASCVLMAAAVALVIGGLTFGPRILAQLR